MKKLVLTTLLSIVFITLTSIKVQAHELSYYKDMMPESTYKYIDNIEVNVVDELESEDGFQTLGVTKVYRTKDNTTKKITIDILEGKEFAVLHEYGHSLDSRVKFHQISNSVEWMKIYILEKNNDTIIFDGNSRNSSSEFFAECFAQYVVQGENLKITHPLAYAFMDSYVKNI